MASIPAAPAPRQPIRPQVATSAAAVQAATQIHAVVVQAHQSPPPDHIHPAVQPEAEVSAAAAAVQAAVASVAAQAQAAAVQAAEAALVEEDKVI